LAPAAVILAAGEGRRMGGVAKALLRVNGEPLVSRLMTALHDAGISDVLVVTGIHHEAIASVVQPMGARVVRNLSPGDGQQSSVRLGLESASVSADALLMVLCDQPLVDAADIQELLAAFKAHPEHDFCVPVVNGQRGNPVVVSSRAVQQILATDRHVACREFMQKNPQTVWRQVTTNDHFITDLDTLADLDALAQRTGWTVESPQGQR